MKERFRVSNVNRGFTLCPSYPQQVIVPSSITDGDIVKVCTQYHKELPLVIVM